MRTEVVVEGFVVLVRDFLDSSECARLVQWSEEAGYEGALLSDGSRRDDVRNNDRVIVDDAALAHKWWPRLSEALPGLPGVQAVGLNERFRFYRYHTGQRFRHHTDGVFFRSEAEFSQFTVLVYLNDDFQGGETTFTRLSIRPETGMALIFHHQIEHAGAPVASGTKYVLRTDAMYRRTPAEESGP